MARFAPLLAAVLSSSLLLRSPAEASIFCARRKLLSAEGVHYTFLRSPPQQAPPSLRLYQGSWSHRRALLSCAWSDDAAVIRDYLSLCRERAREFSDHLEESLGIDSAFGAEDPCVSLASPNLGGPPGKRSLRSVDSSPPGAQEKGSKGRSLHRVKRGFIVPGTLWCGSGNKAPSLGDLGLFAKTDSCCREHDQCKNTILSFHSRFGVFNSNIFTMSHCDCDKKFRSCLLEAGDSISHVVGYTFFNLLKMHCFEFSHRLQCAQRNWFGMCKETKMALYADVHPPTLYEAPSPAQLNHSGSINTSLPEEPTQNSTTPAQLPSGASAGYTLHTPPPPTSFTEDPTPGPEWPTGPVTAQETSPTGDQPLSDLRGMQQACSLYRDLDQCGTKIPPLQNRFGLHNPDAATLYHCNCTSRLFQMLANQRPLTEVHAALLGRVSPSCFLLRSCTAGKICAVVQVTAQSNAHAVKQRHLQATSGSARRPKRKDRTVTLHKMCVRKVGKLRAGWKRKTRKQ
eukprot:XP_003965461.2 PREDICTED: group 3 secretory phospholipase A2 [Takifugu rubripes]